MAFNLGSIFASVGLNVAPLKAGIAKSQAMMGSLDKSMAASSARLGSTMVAGFKKFAKVGVVALAAVGVAAVSMAASFDKSMREVNSLIRLSEAEFGKFKTAVLDMSTTVEHSANELAQGMYWVVSAMPDASDAEGLKVLEASSKLATAGVAEMADAADLMTTALNAWGLSVEDTTHVSDVLLKIVERGKTTLPELAANFSKAATSAAMMGVPIEDLGAVLATLTRIGIPADRALMGLNRTLLGMAKPSEAAAEWIKSIGFESGSAMFETIGFEGVLQKLHAAFGNNVEAMAELFPNIRELMVLLPATGKNFGDIVKDMESFDDAAGTTTEMFDQMAETIQYKWAVTVDKAKKVLIELGERLLPLVEKGIAALTRIIEGDNEAFNAFAGALKSVGTALYNIGKFIVTTKPLLYGLAAAFAAVKVAAAFGGGAGAVVGIKALAAGFMALKFAVGALATGGTIGTVVTSIGAIAGVVAAPVAALGLLINQFRMTSQQMDDMWEATLKSDKASAELAASVVPMVGHLENLRATLAGMTPSTQEYISVEGQLRDVQNEIAGTMPSMIQRFDEFGNAVLRTNDALDRHLTLLMGSGFQAEEQAAKEKGAAEEANLYASELAKLNAAQSIQETQMGIISQLMVDITGDTQGAESVFKGFAKSLGEGSSELQIFMGRIAKTQGMEKLAEVMEAIGPHVNALKESVGEAGGSIEHLAGQAKSMGDKYADAMGRMETETAEMTRVVTEKLGTIPKQVPIEIVYRFVTQGAPPAAAPLPGLTGPGGFGGAAIATMTTDVNNLTNAFQRLVETGLVGWSEAVAAVPFGEAEQGLMNLLRQTGMAEDEMWRQLTVWRETRAAYDAAAAKLDELSSSIAKHENTISALNRRQRDLNDGLSVYRERLEAVNTSIAAQQEKLSRLSQIKITGETAADKKSFDLQLKSKKLQVEILEAEKAENYEKAAMLTLEKERVDKAEAIHTLATETKYAEQKREIEQLLDPLHGQELTQKEIVKQIKKAQKEIAKQGIIRDTLNAKIKSTEALLKKITREIRNEQDAIVLLKIEFDKARVHVEAFKQKIDDMHNHFIAQFQDMQRAAAELAAEIARSAGGGGSYAVGGAGAGGMRMSGARTPEVAGGFGVTVNVPLYIDGKEVAFATTRVTGSNASRYARSGGRY